jgi:hypothetical protein
LRETAQVITDRKFLGVSLHASSNVTLLADGLPNVNPRGNMSVAPFPDIRTLPLQ